MYLSWRDIRRIINQIGVTNWLVGRKIYIYIIQNGINGSLTINKLKFKNSFWKMLLEKIGGGRGWRKKETNPRILTIRLSERGPHSIPMQIKGFPIRVDSGVTVYSFRGGGPRPGFRHVSIHKRWPYVSNLPKSKASPSFPVPLALCRRHHDQAQYHHSIPRGIVYPPHTAPYFFFFLF